MELIWLFVETPKSLDSLKPTSVCFALLKKFEQNRIPEIPLIKNEMLNSFYFILWKTIAVWEYFKMTPLNLFCASLLATVGAYLLQLAEKFSCCTGKDFFFQEREQLPTNNFEEKTIFIHSREEIFWVKRKHLLVKPGFIFKFSRRARIV